MDLAKTLLRTTARAFYTTEHILIIDALSLHSTLTDADLAHALGMQTKALRRLCGKLKEDGLISVQSRGEKKEGAPPTYHSNQSGSAQPKERLFYRDWYYLNFHRAIDSLKYRLHKLSRHIESLGAPTAERRPLVCPRCKSTYTELEVMDNINIQGEFLCHRCGHALNTQEEDESGPLDNESMKRMNDQMARIVGLMRQIDATNVPENDFDTALSLALPINRSEAHPGAKMTIVSDGKPTLASAKGLALAPEKISVNVSEEGAKEDKSDAQLKREKEARQNALPEWISKSTINGAITAVGAREDAQRKEREAHAGVATIKSEVENAEERKVKDATVDSAVMDEYWKELKAEQERERMEEADDDEEEDDEDEEDEFEDIDVGQAKSSNGNGLKRSLDDTPLTSGGASSNATDDEAPNVNGRDVKRARVDALQVAPSAKVEIKNGSAETPKDAVSDEDEFEFEDV